MKTPKSKSNVEPPIIVRGVINTNPITDLSCLGGVGKPVSLLDVGDFGKKPKKTPVGKFLFVWKLKNSEYPGLAKGATFSNRADTQEASLALLKNSEWGSFFNEETEAVLIKSI